MEQKFHIYLMTILKVQLPETLNHLFRRAVSRKLGVAKGCISKGALTAVARYSGVEPTVALFASETFLTVDGPPHIILAILKQLLPKGKITVAVNLSREEVEALVGKVSVKYEGRGYVEFQSVLKPEDLVKLKSFRAEVEGKEIVCEEDCLTVNVDGLQEALKISGELASGLGIRTQFGSVKKKIEFYIWDEPEAQEIIYE